MSAVESGQRRSSISMRTWLFVVEARHRVVGLRLEPGARDAPARQRLEHRQAAAVHRPCTSAVMNTVLPARDRPVTPSRTVGLNRFSPNSSNARADRRASSTISEKPDAMREGSIDE